MHTQTALETFETMNKFHKILLLFFVAAIAVAVAVAVMTIKFKFKMVLFTFPLASSFREMVLVAVSTSGNFRYVDIKSFVFFYCISMPFVSHSFYIWLLFFFYVNESFDT